MNLQAAAAVFILLSILSPCSSKTLSAANVSAPAPSAGPTKKVSITSAMSSHGCKIFAQALSASPAGKTFDDNLDGGLTVFCPVDDAMSAFISSKKYKNLTADMKQSLLEYHGVPVYQSLSDLRTSNGPATTLATDGASNYNVVVQNDGQDVTLKTKVVTARITGTVLDKNPVSVFSINMVLEPVELFKPAPSPTPAPAPAPEADAEAPKPAGKGKGHKSPPAPAAPADSPAGDVADSTADSKKKNSAVRFNAGAGAAAAVASVLSIWFIAYFL